MANLANNIYTWAVLILYTRRNLFEYTMRIAYCVGARESRVVNRKLWVLKPNRKPNRKLRWRKSKLKIKSNFGFYLTKRIFGGIMVATEFGKPTDGADYAEPI